MIELLLRGKQLEDMSESSTMYATKKGTWRYGTYKYIHKFYGGVNAHMICDIYGREIMCDKDTIGLYTGHQDKNGVNIYDGDFYIDIKDGLKYTVVWNKMHSSFEFLIEDDDGDECHVLFYFLDDISKWFVVTGNIHDMIENGGFENE